MAVYPNGRYGVTNPGRYFGAAPGLDLYARGRADRLNVFTNPNRDHITGGAPTGYSLTGVVPPLHAGGMSSRVETHIAVGALGAALMGLPADGIALLSIQATSSERYPLDDAPQSAAGEALLSVLASSSARYPLDDTPQSVTGEARFYFLVPDADGGLISTAQGVANIVVSCNDPLLVASLLAGGTASIFIGAGGTLGAVASVSGESVFSVQAASAARFPTNDSSPLRTGATAIAVSGSLAPYAVGVMSGSTVDNTGLTPASVAQAVWNAILGAASAGDLLQGAGAAGNPWLSDLGGYSSSQAGGIVKIIQRILQNKQVTNPTTGKMTVYADDGVTPLFEADLFENVAETTPYRGQGAEVRGKLS